MWAYSQAGMLLQWAFGGLLGLLVLNRIWPLNPAFGITMPSGYCGGHGTAAAIGQAFSQFGYDEILTLAMTAATFGIVAAVIIGLIIIKWGTKKGHTSFLANYDDLPHELQTGLLPGDKRESMGESSCSSISIDPLTFNLIIVAVIALGGYCISKTVSHFMPGFELPVFSCAFVVGKNWWTSTIIRIVNGRTHDQSCFLCVIAGRWSFGRLISGAVRHGDFLFLCVPT